MLSTILILFRTIFLILGGYEKVALENLALREQLGIFQRSVHRPKIRQRDLAARNCLGLPHFSAFFPGGRRSFTMSMAPWWCLIIPRRERRADAACPAVSDRPVSSRATTSGVEQ